MTTGEKVLQALEARGKVKSEGGGKYRMNSPFRAGSDSHSFAFKISPDGEYGAYKDFRSSEFGSLYDLAEKLGIDVPKQAAIETKRAYKDLDDYASAHGVSGDVFRAAGWKETRATDTNGHDRPALSFPTANGLRYRFLDGEKPTYHSPGGYKNCWYGLTPAVKRASESGLPLVLCNGAPSVVVAHHFGIPALAVSGGTDRLPDALLAELRQAWNGEIIIAMDCDAQGQAATAKLIEQLPTASIVDLNLTAGGDLADLCALYGEQTADELKKRAVKFDLYKEAHDAADLAQTLKELMLARKADGKTEATLETLIDRAQTEIDALRHKTSTIKLVSFAELVSANHKALTERYQNPCDIRGLKSHFPALDKIVGGWQGGRVHMIYGDTNMGKSTLAISIALEWLKQGAGLFLPTESPAAAYLDKIAACHAHVTYDLIESGRLTPEQYRAMERAYAYLETLNCNILDAGSPTPAMLASVLRQGITQYGYKWVVIDSISKMKVPGENDIYDTTRKVADSVQDLCMETGLAFLVTCQIGRNLKDRAVKLPMPNDALGAGTIEQNADVILTLYRHDHYVKIGQCDPNPEFPPNMALVTCVKHRWRDSVGKAVRLMFAGGAGIYELETEKGEQS